MKNVLVNLTIKSSSSGIWKLWGPRVLVGIYWLKIFNRSRIAVQGNGGKRTRCISFPVYFRYKLFYRHFYTRVELEGYVRVKSDSGKRYSKSLKSLILIHYYNIYIYINIGCWFGEFTSNIYKVDFGTTALVWGHLGTSPFRFRFLTQMCDGDRQTTSARSCVFE